jgi:hypothetical protein
VVLTAQGVLYYFKQAFVGGGAAKWKDPLGAMSVIGASCDVAAKAAGKSQAFAVRTPEAQLVFATEDAETDLTAWIRAVRGVAEAHSIGGASLEV